MVLVGPPRGERDARGGLQLGVTTAMHDWRGRSVCSPFPLLVEICVLIPAALQLRRRGTEWPWCVVRERSSQTSVTQAPMSWKAKAHATLWQYGTHTCCCRFLRTAHRKTVQQEQVGPFHPSRFKKIMNTPRTTLNMIQYRQSTCYLLSSSVFGLSRNSRTPPSLAQFMRVSSWAQAPGPPTCSQLTKYTLIITRQAEYPRRKSARIQWPHARACTWRLAGPCLSSATPTSSPPSLPPDGPFHLQDSLYSLLNQGGQPTQDALPTPPPSSTSHLSSSLLSNNPARASPLVGPGCRPCRRLQCGSRSPSCSSTPPVAMAAIMEAPLRRMRPIPSGTCTTFFAALQDALWRQLLYAVSVKNQFDHGVVSMFSVCLFASPSPDSPPSSVAFEISSTLDSGRCFLFQSGGHRANLVGRSEAVSKLILQRQNLSLHDLLLLCHTHIGGSYLRRKLVSPSHSSQNAVECGSTVHVHSQKHAKKI